MNGMICFNSNFSKTLDISDKTFIGRKFSFVVVSPVLKAGDLSAFLRVCGNVQFSITELAMFENLLIFNSNAHTLYSKLSSNTGDARPSHDLISEAHYKEFQL